MIGRFHCKGDNLKAKMQALSLSKITQSYTHARTHARTRTYMHFSEAIMWDVRSRSKIIQFNGEVFSSVALTAHIIAFHPIFEQRHVRTALSVQERAEHRLHSMYPR